MTEREKILCPSCGAALPPSAAGAAIACPFCGVASAPAAPKVEVVERIVERVVVVAPPSSGAGAGTSAPPKLCPRCRTALFEGRAKDVLMNGCGTCGGIWLDNDASQRAIRAVDRDVLELADRAEKHATRKPAALPAGLPCAECAQPMARVLAPRGRVELDVCATHGTWFDRHELRVVMMAYSAPDFSALPGPYDHAELPDFRSTGQKVGVGVLSVLGAMLSVAVEGQNK